MIGVGLADDQALFTHGVAMVVDSQPDLRVVWRAADGEQAINANADATADVVLMDVQMPRLDGIAATRRIAAEQSSRVIILTTFDDEDYVTEGLAAGASGFLLKDTPPEQLLAAIRTVHEGDAVISPRSTARLLERVRPALGGGAAAAAGAQPGLSPADRRVLAELTPREQEILVAVARGWTNLEIAERLFISMPTVKTHVSHVLAKTGSRDRVQAVLFAFRTGLVAPADLLAAHPEG
ncbi:response regulator transcription factor [Mariniluteicoccus endophyticus]